MSNFSFLVAAEQIICRTPPLDAPAILKRNITKHCDWLLCLALCVLLSVQPPLKGSHRRQDVYYHPVH